MKYRLVPVPAAEATLQRTVSLSLAYAGERKLTERRIPRMEAHRGTTELDLLPHC